MLKPRTPFLVSVLLGFLGALLAAALKAIFDVTVQDFWKDTATPFLREHVGPWSATMLEWIGPFWLGAGSAFALMFLVEMAFAWRRREATRRDQAIDLSKSVFHGIEIDLQRLLSQLSTNGKMIAVDGKLFTECKFIGPACMVMDGDTNFIGNFKLEDVGHPLELRPQDAIVGAPVFINCTFQSVAFKRVQLIVPQKSYREIYRSFSEHIPVFQRRDPAGVI
ncbi:hypothetical protein MKK88_22850 [Methylobacterium sp. E-005]|uniref:hypothetical protein n=1 Tax=Methylobacterium sp. E-005 TaxID=2836549 RepID=UPI001FB87C84|nr:hypothetical protein [Methylobacterium sp. E-005]MCJ2088798.1 hypothetical protein [Methylobacterium sp. E-005]